ncbi:hypothetical protein DR950_05785 [Kitasatospora xanthocidica]|uniref:Uncharacterized protein n=1 Tax=Kitasatospora xanthocidica TaxID=83382 RepID=A0A372ZNB2_9ACTN|nr:hypothetical protein DR950_05785 [Kitasatospora xanthocidica]
MAATAPARASEPARTGAARPRGMRIGVPPDGWGQRRWTRPPGPFDGRPPPAARPTHRAPH